MKLTHETRRAAVRPRFLLSARWVAAAALAALALVCLEAEPQDPREDMAFFLSRIAYGAFLSLALALLALSPRGPQAASDGRVAPSAWWWADVMLCTYTFVPLLQWLIPLQRPPDSPITYLNGFPSGHMVSVFALSWLLAKAYPWLGVPAFGFSVLIGWARLESQSHFAYQVLAGAAVGLALGWWDSRHADGVLLPRALGWFGRRTKTDSSGTST